VISATDRPAFLPPAFTGLIRLNVVRSYRMEEDPLGRVIMAATTIGGKEARSG